MSRYSTVAIAAAGALQPRMLNSKSSILTALSYMTKTYGYKWVYLHEIDDVEDPAGA